MGLRLPGFLELILPLSFFLAILLAFGRLYGDNEMSVMAACGVSRAKLLGYTLIVAGMVSMIVAWLVLFVNPYNAANVEKILYDQAQRTEIDAVKPSSFISLKGGAGVVFAEQVSGERNDVVLSNVFVALADQADLGPVVVHAPKGYPEVGADGRRYLVLEDGYRTQGEPGQLDFTQILFDRMGHHIPRATTEELKHSANAMATKELIGTGDLSLESTFQWRLSLIVLVPVVTIMGFALSKTRPRQGRYARIIPAVFLYVFYLSMLNSGRGWIEDGDIPAHIGLLPIHFAFVALAFWLYYRSERIS